MLPIIWFQIILQLTCSSNAWPSYATVFGTGHRFPSHSPYSTWHTIRAVDQTEQRQKSDSKELVVKHLTNLRYKGLNYVMVHNLSLSFEQAERYCNQEFSQKMHLASIQSENEWKILSKTLSLPYPSEIWLGGQSYYTDAGLFLIKWIDDKPFEYHRFTSEEMGRWQANWRYGGHGCIFGGVQADGQGNWSVQLAPCSEPRRFVCKEEDHKPKEVKPVIRSQDVRGHLNGLASMIHMLFGSRLFYQEPVTFNSRVMQIPAGRWNQLISTKRQAIQSSESGTVPMTTQSPLPPKAPINIPIKLPDNMNAFPPTDVTKTSEQKFASTSTVNQDQTKVPLVNPSVVSGEEMSRLNKSMAPVSWSIPKDVPKNGGQVQPVKLGFNVLSSTKTKDVPGELTNETGQKGSSNSPANPSETPAAHVLLDWEDDIDKPAFVSYPHGINPRNVFRTPTLRSRDFGGQKRNGFILI